MESIFEGRVSFRFHISQPLLKYADVDAWAAGVYILQNMSA